eukprot:IDg20540t1
MRSRSLSCVLVLLAHIAISHAQTRHTGRLLSPHPPRREIQGYSARYSLPTNCSTGLQAWMIFRNCYHSTYDLIRRGLAHDIAAAHVRSAVRDFAHYALSSTLNAASVGLGDVCIPVEQYSSKFTVRWTSVYTESELDDMLMTISNSFYHVSKDTSALPAPSAAQESERTALWNLFRAELQHPPRKINYNNIRFPPTA